MSSIVQCEYNIKRYNSLKANINSVISNLSSAISNAENLSDGIRNKYQINDDDTPIVARTIQLKDSITATCDFLSNKIIPAIDAAIYSLNREITQLEQEEYEKNQDKSG